MTLSNDDLIRRFVRGRKKGESCNMKIKELTIDGQERGTIILDYGWALLSHRTKRGNHITLFDGWYGYSVTTSTHLNKIRPHADKIKDCRVQYRKSRHNIKTPREWDGFPFDTKLEQKVEEYT